jgi:hypothetical protein
MFSQRSWLVIQTGVLALVVTVLMMSFPTLAVAQCGNPEKSTCLTCHARQDPVLDKGEWHIIHAGKDLCLNCHGGNGTSADPALAHQGMTAAPLSDVYTDCHSCHPDDYTVRAQRFASSLGRTVGSCATPTPIPAEPVSYHPILVQSAPIVEASRASSAPSMIFGVTVLVCGLGLAVTLILRRL